MLAQHLRIPRLLSDDGGQDLVEYALLTAIVGICAVLVVPTIRTTMAVLFSNWGDQTWIIWTPPPPPP